MASTAITGQGATISLSGGATGCVRSIKLPEWSQEKIDASCLSTTDWKKFIAGDLVDPGQIEVTAVFLPDDVPTKPDKVPQDVTVTFPLSSGGTSAGSLTGSGFIMSTSGPNFEMDTLAEVSFTFCFDGDGTPPTYTAEVAA